MENVTPKNSVTFSPFSSHAPRLNYHAFQLESFMLQQYEQTAFASKKTSNWQEVIWSLTCHSMVLKANALEALCKLIQTDTLTLTPLFGHLFTTVQLKGTTNLTLEDGEKVCEELVPLHPISVALIQRLDATSRSKLNWLSIALPRPHSNAIGPKTLSEFCQAAVAVVDHLSARALPEHLIMASVGKLPTSTLPLQQLTCLTAPSINGQLADTVQLQTIFKPAHTSFNEHTSRSHPLYEHLRAECKLIREQQKPTAEHVISRLTLLKVHCRSLAEQLLLDWYIYKLEVDKIKISSFLRYHSALSGPWLATLEHVDIESLETHGLDEHYEIIIHSTSSNPEQVYKGRRLKDIHQFAFQTIGIAPTSLTFPTNSRAHVRAAFVGETHFKQLLIAVDSQNHLSDFDKDALKVFLIMKYRGFFRPGELAKLMVRNIELSNELWCYVLPNRFGHNKSAHAKRKVLLRPLLKEDEWQLVAAFIRAAKLRHQDDENVLLFHQEFDAHTKLDTLAFSRWVSLTLKAITGDSAYCLYSLRHTGISRLYLIFNGIGYLDEIVPYTPLQIDAILNALLGGEPNRVMIELASMAGHESPRVTYKSYIHFHPILKARIIQSIQVSLTVPQMRRLGLSQTSGYEWNAPSARKVNYDEAVNKVWKMCGNPTLPEPHIAIESKPNLTLRATNNVDVRVLCYSLELIMSGIELSDVATQYQITLEILEAWHAYYVKLKAQLPERLNRTLFELPHTKKACSELFRLIRSLKKLSDHEKIQLNEVVPYILNHFPSSKSGIYISSPRVLKKITQALQPLIKHADWDIELVNHHHKRVKIRWAKSLQSMTIRREYINPNQKKASAFLYYLPPTKGNQTERKSTRLIWQALFLWLFIEKFETSHS